jgi:hypothetical protein
MAERKSLSKRTRFEIFKRDSHRCVYCGATPLEKPLHVDHVIAVANGGNDDPANLVTACRDCNAGKSAVPLERKKFAPVEMTEEIEDRAELVRLYMETQQRTSAALQAAAEPVIAYWEERVGPITQGMADRLGALITEWPIEKLQEAIQITARKLGTPDHDGPGYYATKQAKYFNGILRRWREEMEAPRQPQRAVAEAVDPHIERARKALTAACAEVNAKPDTLKDWKSIRTHIYSAFTEAAWGGPFDVAYPHSEYCEDHDLEVRGLRLVATTKGSNTHWRVEAVPGFNAHEQAYDELQQAVWEHLPIDEAASAEAVQQFQTAAVEISRWLGARTHSETTNIRAIHENYENWRRTRGNN